MNENDDGLGLNSPEVNADRLLKHIDKRIENIIKGLKFDKTYSAKIMAVGTGKADIRLQGGTTTITNVPNKTGVTLIVNDEVFVEAINNSLSNLVIKYKK